MNEYRLLINILYTEYAETYREFYKNHDINTMFISLCSGTASKSMINYLGLERNEKVMIQTVVPKTKASQLMRGLVNRMGINLPGTGIALTIPIGSFAGSFSYKYLTEGEENTNSEVIKMNDVPYALITVIAQKGFSDMVMDAAREAGAGGGTVVHARGTGAEETTKFLGVSLVDEREIIYIVAKKSEKDEIMKSIIKNAGPSTEAKAVVYSLPVDSVAGLHSMMQEQDGE